MSYTRQYALKGKPQSTYQANSNPELQHYGRKGMKWGKSIFSSIVKSANNARSALTKLVTKSKLSSKTSSIYKALKTKSGAKKVSSNKTKKDYGVKKKTSSTSKSGSNSKTDKTKKSSKKTSKKSSKKTSKKTTTTKATKIQTRASVTTGSNNKAASLTSGANASASEGSSGSIASARKSMVNGLDRFAYDQKNTEISNSLVQALKDLVAVNNAKK